MTTVRKLSGFSPLLLILAALPHTLSAQTTVTLSPSGSTTFGSTLVLSVATTPPTATGRVTFYDGVTVLGTKSLTSGAASLSTSQLPAGSHKLKAYYAGDASNAAATSNIVTLSISAQASAGLAVRNPLSVAATSLLAVGDFNGDGKADLVIRNSGTLQVLLGDGAGNFATPGYTLTTAGLTPAAAAIGDFNGDGKIDLAIASSTSIVVTILLGNGDGTFQLPTTYPVPNALSGLLVADFNGDGKADLATADPSSGVNTLLGNGDGTFQTAVAHVTNPAANGNSQASFVLAGDFNGDGKVDLATVNANSPNLGILLGNGDGTFQTAALAGLPSQPLKLAIGDFNGDGKADLATNNANILLGRGDGTFQAPVTYATGSNPLTVAVGDVNGDGVTDLVFSDGVVSVLMGTGTGTFSATPSVYTLASSPSSVFVGEFSGDGKTDLAFVSAGAISFLLGTTVSVTPTAGTPQSTAIRTAFPVALQVTVKDGATPVSGVTVTFTAPSGGVTDTFPQGAPTATLSSNSAVTDANGMASVTATASPASGSYFVTATALGVSTSFALTNLVGSSLVLTQSPTLPQSALRNTAFSRFLQITLKDSSGLPASGVAVTFTVPANGASAVLSSPTAVTNAAGVASVTATANNVSGSYTVTATAAGLTASFAMTNQQPVVVSLASSSNPSNFGAALTLTATASNFTSSGKITFFDGVSIIGAKPVFAGVASLSTVLLSAGVHSLTAFYRDDATFTTGVSSVLVQTIKAAAGGAFIVQSPLSVSAISQVVMGDFNGDGKVDLAFASSNSSTGTLQVLIGKGDGTFQAPVSYSTGAGNLTALAVGDFNGDGNSDLAVTSSANSLVNVLLGVGDGTFRSAVTYPTGSNFTSGNFSMIALAVGDFNNDGKADLVTGYVVFNGSLSQSALILLPGNGDGTFGTAIPYANAAPPFVLGDFNVDGKPDFAAAPGNASASPGVLLGNGDGTTQPPTSNLTLSGTPTSFVSGDFNNDGKADLAIGGFNTTWILLGNGNGTFQPAVSYNAGAAVSTGDFNGDGTLDLLVSNTTGAAILQGNGDGTFTQKPASNISANTPLLVSDFNGDGTADILTVTSNGVLTVLLGANTVALSLTATGGANQSASNGTPFPVPLQVTALNNGIPLSGVTITFTAPSSGASASLSSSTAVTNAAGVASVNATANFTSGSYLVTASYQGSTATFALSNTSFAFITATGGTPQSTTVGTAFPTALQATVKDSLGNPVNGVTVTFSGPATGAGAVLSSATAVTNSAGIASVTATANLTAGTYVVTAASGSVSAQFQLTNTAAAPASITASAGAPQSALLGVAFPVTLQATVKDASGNPVSGVTVSFTAPASGASATLSGATAVTNASGVASVTAIANNTAGTYNVMATAGAFSVPFALTNTTLGSITATGGNPQSTLAGTAFPSALQVTVKDTNGSPVPGVNVTFTAPVSGAGATLSGTTALTNASGVATITATANTIAGSYSVIATVGTLTATFSLTNANGAAVNIVAFAGTPQSVVVNTPFTVPLQVSVRDASGALINGATVTFTAPTVGASALLSSATVVTNASGVASVTAIANAIAGSYAVTASTGNVSTTFSLTNLTVGQNADLALGKSATQSSTLPGSPSPAAAVDGNTDGNFYNNSVTHTNADLNAWWQVDLGAPASIGSVTVWNRTDCCGDRLSDYWVFVSNTPFLSTDTPATLQNRAGTFASHQTTAPSPSAMIVIPGGTQGQYVRVQLSGANNLSLAEVQVTGTGGGSTTNLSQGRPATQSSTLAGYSTDAASAAVDGNTDGNFFDGSVTHTNADPNAWWQVDLGASAAVTSVVIWNRTDACCISRLSDYWVFVSDTPFLATDTPATLQGRADTAAFHQTTAPNPSTTIQMSAQGRYVRVQLSGTNNLNLAEVQVFGTGGAPAATNLAVGKAASQSSTLPGYFGAFPASAVDGNTNGGFFSGSVTHTNADANAWWQVDLGASAAITSIALWNRTDCCGDRLSDYWVFVSDTPFLATDTPATLQSRAGTFAIHQTTAPNPSTTIQMTAQGRYVRVQLSGTNNLSLAEVQVFGTGGAPTRQNLSQGKVATQSSTLPGYSTDSASSAVDGITDGNFFDGSVTHTNADPNAWWQVDLGATNVISSIVIWNRTDCCGDRLSNYWVFVSSTPFLPTDTPATLQTRADTVSANLAGSPNPATTVFNLGTHGRYVRVQLSGTNNLSLAEVQVFGGQTVQ
jgi:protocatechuate 3,4-dioxygenase beta subunit